MKNKITTGILLSIFLIFSDFLQAAAPTTQASNVQISWKSVTAASITWTRGNGSACMVVMRQNTSAGYVPASPSTTNYSASPNYGAGSTVNGAIDNYIVYKGTASSIFVTGLTANTLYDIYIYEYNIVGSTYYYNTVYSGSSAVANTLGADPSSCGSITSATSITNSSANVNFTAGGGSGRMITIVPSYWSATAPTDGVYYGPSSTYGGGYNIGNAYVVYAASGTNVNITGLSGATTYDVYDYEYVNGTYPTSGSYNYNSRNYSSCGSYSFSTTNIPPTVDAISSMSICENTSFQYVSLSGITDGSNNESQSLTVTASSSNTALIPNPSVNYSSPNSTGDFYLVPTAGQYGSTIITVTVNDGWSSNNITTTSFIVTVKPIPSATGIITGASPICAGIGTQNYSIASVANATGYTWSVPTGWNITGGNGTTTVSISTTSTSGSGSISVYGTNANGCGNGVSSSKIIQVDAQPVAPNAGTDQATVCSGSAFLNATAVSAPNVGQWSWLSGTPTPSIGSTSSNSTSISGLTGANTYKYIWTVNNGGVCPAKKDTVSITTDWANVICTPAANFSYSPVSDVSPTTVCTGSVISFTDLSVSANQWQWDFEYNGSTPNFTSTTQANTYQYNTVGTYTVYLKIYSNATSQFYTTSKPITVIDAPTAPGTIFGTTSGICAGNINQFVYSIASVTNATGYNWSVPPGAGISANPSPTSIAVTYSNSALPGNIAVSASNSCGTSAVNNLMINVNPLPVAAATITGAGTVCQGQTNVAYTVPSITYATGYEWTSLSGTQSNTTPPTINYNFSNTALSGQIWVKGINSCGIGDSSSIAITVNPLPDNAGFVTGNTLLSRCPVANAENYWVPAINNATSYSWQVSNGGVITSAVNDTAIVVDFSATTSQGTIQVTGINACGSGIVSAPLTVDFVSAQLIDLCVVTVDTLSQHNEIYWEHPATSGIDSFRIYRKLTALIDTLVGTVSYIDPGYLLDTLGIDDPNTNPLEYTISAVDSCGNEGPKGAYHETMFLTVGNGPGVVNLSWNQYVGQTVNYYRILRDTIGNGTWELLNGLVPPNTIVYTDNNPPSNLNMKYKVEVDWLTTCDPSRGAINTSRSNIKTNTFVGIKENNIDDKAISVYPNPAHDLLTLELKQQLNSVVVTIFNAIGEMVYNEKPVNAQNRIVLNTENFAKGIYTIMVNTDKGRVTKKLVID